MNMEKRNENNSNKPLLKKILHYAGVLTAVCLFSGAGVSLLYVASAGRIAQQEAKAFENTLAEVIGDAQDPQELLEDVLWAAITPEGQVRYVAEGKARGYQSDITVLVSVDAEAENVPVPDDASLYRLVVLSSAETPGLGEDINAVKRTVSLWKAIIGEREEPGRPWFQTQFEGKNMEELRLKIDNGQIDSITGATETSQATTEAAQEALKTIIEKTGELYD